MTGATGTDLIPARAYASGPADQAVREIVDALRHRLHGQEAVAVLWFASSVYDPTELAAHITAAFPDAAVMGCSTAGEFTDAVIGTGGISAIALPHGILTGALAALGDLSRDAASGTWSAVRHLEHALGSPLRDLDPATHLGLVLIDGVNGAEEDVNEVVGNAAPLLDVVGGSAGDDLAFRHTWVAVGAEVSYRGMALMVCRTGVPFHIVKASAFAPTGRVLRITEADVATRTVRTMDGRRAIDAYADAVGVRTDQFVESIWRRHPLGLMIDGQPWLRAPHSVTPEGHLVFFAQILPGIELEVMQATDIVAGTAEAIRRARAALGGRASGALMFNCILRRLEIDEHESAESFVRAFDGLPLAGFHTYGETWIGHVNQSLTGVVFG